MTHLDTSEPPNSDRWIIGACPEIATPASATENQASTPTRTSLLGSSALPTHWMFTFVVSVVHSPQELAPQLCWLVLTSTAFIQVKITRSIGCRLLMQPPRVPDIKKVPPTRENKAQEAKMRNWISELWFKGGGGILSILPSHLTLFKPDSDGQIIYNS